MSKPAMIVHYFHFSLYGGMRKGVSADTSGGNKSAISTLFCLLTGPFLN